MTQLFHSSSTNSQPLPTEKRNLSGLLTSSTKQNGPNHFPERIRNFFRSSSILNDGSGNSKAGSKIRQSRFLGGITKSRSGVANEATSTKSIGTSLANTDPSLPHGSHQRLINNYDGSHSPSPTNYSLSKVDGASHETMTTAESSPARKLRRVASAPGAQGHFLDSDHEGRPSTADLGMELVVSKNNAAQLRKNSALGASLPPSARVGPSYPGKLRQSKGFPRTYSSNSIKVKDVEVGPASFDKIKMIGKGDVGKVYLVREKKSSKLFAMKGISHGIIEKSLCRLLTDLSCEQKGNDKTK